MVHPVSDFACGCRIDEVQHFIDVRSVGILAVAVRCSIPGRVLTGDLLGSQHKDSRLRAAGLRHILGDTSADGVVFIRGVLQICGSIG